MTPDPSDLIAAALEQSRRAGASAFLIPIPGTDQFVALGTMEQLQALVKPADDV